MVYYYNNMITIVYPCNKVDDNINNLNKNSGDSFIYVLFLLLFRFIFFIKDFMR